MDLAEVHAGEHGDDVAELALAAMAALCAGAMGGRRGAVEAAGADRERLAFTLAKVALGPSEAPRAVAAISGLGVVAVAMVAAVQAHHVVALL